MQEIIIKELIINPINCFSNKVPDLFKTKIIIDDSDIFIEYNRINMHIIECILASLKIYFNKDMFTIINTNKIKGYMLVLISISTI